MKFKIIYTRRDEAKKLIIEAATIKAALQLGAKQTQWDSILEITTDDDQTIQGKI